MGKSIVGSVLAFSAFLVMGVGQGWARLHLPAGQSQPTLPAPVPGQSPGIPAAWDAEEPRELPSGPVQEDKSDCDDCVIVLKGDSTEGDAAGTGGNAEGAEDGSLLAGTLWGLFGVSRPKRIPRTHIRGLTVP
jgi:hypothetical protein